MTENVKNAVVIVVDALRTDRVGVYSGGSLTPNIDSLAQDGEVFERCYSCINATDPSVTTILTGQYPIRHGILNHGGEITEVEQNRVSGTTPFTGLLTDTHQSIGIDTLERWHKRGFNQYHNPRFNERNAVLNRLDSDGKISSIANKVIGVLGFANSNRPVRSEAITDLATDFIRRSKQPFFLFTHYWESHVPYIPMAELPDWIRDRNYDDDEIPLEEAFQAIKGSPWKKRLDTRLTGGADTIADMKHKYDAGIWKVDKAVGEMIAVLKDQNLFEETAIIVTADHGESLTEHGIYFDHHGLYDPSVHVPLIINAPGFDGRETQFVQHFDLAPTILDLVDVDYSGQIFDGNSLVHTGSRSLNREAVYIEESHTNRRRAIRTETHKYIKKLDDRELCRYCEIKHGSDEELYNLNTDPDETRNIIDKHPEVAQELERKLDSWIRNLPDPMKKKESFEPSDEVKDHLEEMGYI